MVDGNARHEILGELEKRGWERGGGCWRSYPFMLTRHAPKDASIGALWHLDRIDEHPGHAWFSNETLPELFTIVDAERKAWR